MEAAEVFVRYWAGDEAWENMPTERKEITANGMRKVRQEFAGEIAGHLSGLNTRNEFAKITVPVGYFMGSATKSSVKRVAELLVPAFQNGTHEVINGLGHIGPVTHPAVFNEHVRRFLMRMPGRRFVDTDLAPNWTHNDRMARPLALPSTVPGSA